VDARRDAEVPDAEVPDAEVPDAEVPDPKVPVYVINVDGHTLRLCAVRARAAALGMDLIRWPATTDAELDPATLYRGELADGVRVRDFAPWSGSEAACGISHIRLLRAFVASGVPWCVVLEDDAVILDRFPATVRAWRLPADAEIVLLNDRSAAGPVEVVSGRFGYCRAVGGAGTDGYLISRPGAGKLLRVLDPLKDPLDFQMYAHFASVRGNDRPPYFWRLPRNAEADGVELTAYRIEPPLVGHRDGESVIGNARHPRARFYCRVLLGLEFNDDGGSYRYGYLRATARPAAPGRAGAARAAAARASAGRFFTGVDVSHLDTTRWPAALSGQPRGNPLDLLVDTGVNAVRMSAWVGASTAFGTHRLLRVAREAADRGLALCVALHYSDTWADPGRQTKPADWRALGPPELDGALYAYTYDLVAALCRQGTPPAVVQVGNEITNGMLWAGADQADHAGGRLWRPEGEAVPLDYDSQWAVFAGLVRTAVAGVRAAAADWDAPVEVMVHIDTGAYAEQAEWWLRRAVDHGIDFDLAGLSFYPMWHDGATVRAVEELALLGMVLPDVGVVLAETSYPYRVPTDVAPTRPLQFPLTPSGQRDYLAAVLRSLRGLPTGRGLFWWGAFFLDGADCHRAHALVDQRGRPVAALTAFGEASRAGAGAGAVAGG
jgi:arabinogalactan endo-1,4-beta-galactosidase